MRLLDPGQPIEEPTPAQAALAAHRFVLNCIEWASDRELPKRTALLKESPSVQSTVDLLAWASFRDFMEHARQELEAGTLDNWFMPPDAN